MTDWDKSPDISIDEGVGAFRAAAAELGVPPSLNARTLRTRLGPASISWALPELVHPTPNQLYARLPHIDAIPPSRFNGTPKLLAILGDRMIATEEGVLHFMPKPQNTSLWGTGVLLISRERGFITATRAIRDHTYTGDVDKATMHVLRNRADGMFNRLAERMACLGIDILFEPGQGVMLEPGIVVADLRRTKR